MLFANYLTDTNEALLFLSYAIINQPKLNLQERPAARANARNAADRAYASMTASGASARSAWAAASASTSASAASARTAAAMPPTEGLSSRHLPGDCHIESGVGAFQRNATESSESRLERAKYSRVP